MKTAAILTLIALLLFAWTAMRAAKITKKRAWPLRNVFKDVKKPEPDPEIMEYGSAVKWTINDRRTINKEHSRTEPPAN